MEFLLEALLEAVLEIVFEVVIALLNLVLEGILGPRVAAKVRIGVSMCFYLVLGAVGGAVSVKILPRPLGGGAPNFWMYFFVLPIGSALGLFLLMRKTYSVKSEEPPAVFACYCVGVSFAFTVTRYIGLV